MDTALGVRESLSIRGFYSDVVVTNIITLMDDS